MNNAENFLRKKDWNKDDMETFDFNSIVKMLEEYARDLHYYQHRDKMKVTQKKRHELAKAAMQGMLSNGNAMYAADELIKESFRIADRFIKEEGSGIPDGLKINIHGVRMSERCSNVMRYEGITYLHEIAQFAYQDFKKFRSVGKKTRDEMTEILHEYGLSWADE